ncbi:MULTISPECIES: ATP-binding cassette domain-containing protein [Ruminococcus]|uniref:ATP-binding cassette domain-containing protein n=1 Tax=Ruminococcus TaxID=1263 RepID=UPI003FA72A3D
MYDLFPILPKFAKRKGGDLSDGQQQQLAIAKALAAEPKILILDEPTEGIQPSIIQDIGAAIQKINEWKGDSKNDGKEQATPCSFGYQNGGHGRSGALQAFQI